jgi:hypothetical protein
MFPQHKRVQLHVCMYLNVTKHSNTGFVCLRDTQFLLLSILLKILNLALQCITTNCFYLVKERLMLKIRKLMS